MRWFPSPLSARHDLDRIGHRHSGRPVDDDAFRCRVFRMAVVGRRVAVLLTFGLLSLGAMVSTMRMERRVQRLRRDGRAAVADVVDSRSVSLGEGSGVEVTVHISGAEIATFQVVHRGSDGAIGRLGARFPVVVDPKDHAYVIVR